MDDNLSWNYQTKEVCNNIAKNIGVLAKLKFLPIPVLRMLYHAFITSTINYGVIVWGFTTKRNIQKKFLLQKRAIRLITHSHYLSESAPLFKINNILPIQNIISLQTCLFMYQCHNQMLPKSLQDYFKMNNSYHSYRTRNCNNYHPPLPRTLLTKRSVFYFGPIFWNTLPNSFKLCKSLNQFKRACLRDQTHLNTAFLAL